jgi:topoisomerase IA-like protein
MRKEKKSDSRDIMEYIKYIKSKRDNPEKYLCKECKQEEEYSMYNIRVYRNGNWVEIESTAHLCEMCLMRKKGIYIDMDEEDEEKRYKFLS